jgi:diketogulonate reductase-like aldo/keto reductase
MQTKSGKSVFPIGIGTWGISSRINPDSLSSKYIGVEAVHGNEATEIEALRYSVLNGQNHIDCAELYGGFYTDEVIGQAITGSKRADLYIALISSGSPVSVTALCGPRSNRCSGTDYIDLLYIHAPFDDAPWAAAVPQIDRLIDEGIVRHLGVSNFSIDQMRRAMQLAKHPLTANQMNYNVLHKSEVDQAFRDFCHQNDIQIVAYQPIKRQEVLRSETIQKIAQAHTATPAQVALAWLIDKDALPIPKALQKEHIDENIRAVHVVLTAQEIAQLDRL